MGRPCARAHRCVRLSQTKNLLNNMNLQWREQNAITPSFKTRPYDMEMPSARDCPMGALRVAPRHRRSREAYSTDCVLRGDSGGRGTHLCARAHGRPIMGFSPPSPPPFQSEFHF
ncbi:hypothetical protein EVAR_612_1 [Eumeta japonica]|uniref:Uncharacterized protein n=1 Tax=Eumeta variegata TaxID=151549 RepID=A0A4C1SB52_EUMVA|nr:hypothetical protein EVAR_612_1 [Eumeta japonica]